MHFKFVFVACLLMLMGCESYFIDGVTQRDVALMEAQALKVLETSCGNCHQSGKTAPDVSNRDAMIQGGFVLPGNPDESELIKRVSPGGNMPLGQAPLSSDQVQVLRDWVQSLAAQANDRIAEEDVLRKIKDDLSFKVSPARQRSVRYFSLHVSNNRHLSADAMKSLRDGFTFLLNSFSWSDEVYKPEAIDDANLIYRVDLKEIDMDPSVFERVINGYYPFNSIPSGTNVSKKTSESISNLTSSTVAYVRLEWFVATAALPEVYLKLLMPQLEKDDFSQPALEKFLSVPLQNNIKNKKVMRAGFESSGVSSQNRMIERHEQGVNGGLPYWLSYDFGPSEEKGNLFKRPLSKHESARPDVTFVHDGGEVIFQLPNGFLGYFLATADGKSIDRGPKEIVIQPNGGPDEFNGYIVNGMSCMNCHSAGLIYKKDEVKNHYQKAPGSISSDELTLLEALYVPDDQFKSAMDRDNAFYQGALNSAGLGVLSTPGPVDESFRVYNKALSRDEVAAELDITVDGLMGLLQQEPFASEWISLKNGERLRRDKFNARYSEAVTKISSDRTLVTPKTGDVIITQGCIAASSLSLKQCVVVPKK